MRNHRSIIILLVFLHLNGFAFAAISRAWIKRSEGIIEAKVNCLYVGSRPDDFILAGTDKALYRSDNNNKTFQPVLQLYGNYKTINQIKSDLKDAATLYTATDAGVFVSHDQGVTWENIFAPGNTTARKAFCVLADGGTVYAGTADGLYIRRAGETEWKKDAHELGKTVVLHLADAGDFVYAATESEIYSVAKNGGQVERMYTAINQQDEEAETDDDGEENSKSLIKDFVSINDGKKIFAVIGHDVLWNEISSVTWKKVPVDHLPVEDVRKLLVNVDEDGYENLFAATGKGFFRYNNGRWENDMAGLTTNYINDVAVDEGGKLVLATQNGVFVQGEEEFEHLRYADIAQNFIAEPSVNDVQKMAIEYANVNPAQIRSWHDQARAKAFLPSVSVGLNRADGEMYHWDTGPNPDVLTKGRDYLDWSTTLSWDFSDLVWSSDRTSIDSRAKLMSELRQDILDQVTRLYFERRRIQVELASVKEGDFDRQMRVEELTALLDGLTGGEFSRRAHKDSPSEKR